MVEYLKVHMAELTAPIMEFIQQCLWRLSARFSSHSSRALSTFQPPRQETALKTARSELTQHRGMEPTHRERERRGDFQFSTRALCVELFFFFFLSIAAKQ